MRPLSVVEQDKLIRRDFPDFRLLFDGGFVGAWEGTVVPIARAYRLSILYYPRRYFETWHPHERSGERARREPLIASRCALCRGKTTACLCR